MNNFQEQFTVTVSTKELIETLKKNKEQHKKKFLDALEGWKRDTKQVLADAIVDIDNNKSLKIAIIEDKPRDMTQEYTKAIQLLEWNRTDTIKLDHQKFDAFVNDNWQWTHHWSMHNNKYLSS